MKPACIQSRQGHGLPHAPRTLALLVAALFAGSSQANSGRIEFVSGGATLRNTQGERPLTRGTEIRTGDTVVTTNGRTQIRFSDGAYVSLQPETEFSIEQYRFDGRTDGNESSIFGLVKGAMRTVTGLVGRVNRDKYQIRTPSATVGIRGTGGIVSVGLNGLTRIIGTSGTWVLTNQAGTVEVPAGRAGVAGPDQSKPPQQSNEAPQAPAAPPATQTSGPSIAASEQRNTTGTTTFVADFDTGKPVGVAYAEALNGAVEIDTLLDGSVAGTSISVKGNVDTSGKLTGFTFTNSANTAFKWTFTGTLNEGGSDSTVGWGRWTGTVTLPAANGGSTVVGLYGPNGGFHYVVGSPTTAMPQSGYFTSTMLGATAPTINNGAFAPGSVSSASLSGQFTPTGGSFDYDVNFTMNSISYNLQASGTISGSKLSGSGQTYGTGCCSSCSATVTGGFFGTGASHAGVAYKGNINGGVNSVGGATVHKLAPGLPPS